MSGEIEFLEELPESVRASQYPEFWASLRAHPGLWAKWPGSSKTSGYGLAQAHSRNGERFEGRRRGDVVYMRFVP